MDQPEETFAAPDTSLELEAAVDQVIASCDGDPRAAVRGLLVAMRAQDAEIAQLRREVDGLAASVSRGYARGRFIGRGEWA